MARGYLGKISAIVSANTGDYVRKLDDSARRTKAFAQTIQTDLNRASRDSAKALSSMLTPLQRLERAIQNATSQRLKFNGVDTAINSVKQLQAVISRLEGSEIDVAVRTSGLRSLDELKRTLQNLKQEDVDLFVNLVGSEGTVADLRKIRESYREIDGKVVSTNVAVKADVSQVDRLIELFSQFSKQRLDAVINVVGQQQVDKAALSMRQIFSIAEGLAKPLGGAAQQLAGMSLGIQTQFGPALQRAQQEVQTLSDAADRGARITRRAYNDAAASVERVTAAISRLNEAQSLANSGRTGQELTFRAPRVQDELASSAQVSQQAANLPVALREDPSVRARIEELARLRQEIAKYQASVERRTVLGLDTSAVQARLDSTIRKSADVRASLEQTIKIDLDDREAQARADRLKASIDAFRENLTFSITGEVQNFDQARQELSRLTGAVEQFDVTQRAAFGANLQELGEIVAANDVTKLDRVRELIGQIGEAAGQQKTLNLETAEAQRKTDRLKASIDAIRENITFTITGEVQNIDQARQELSRLTGAVEQFDVTQRAAFGANLQELGEIVAANDVTKLDRVRELIGQIGEAAGQQKTLNLETAEAQRKTDRLKASIDELRASAEFTITGRPQNIDQVQTELNRVVGTLDKLDDAQRSGLQVRVNAVIEAIGQDDLTEATRLLDELRVRSGQEIEFKVETDAAVSRIRAINEAWDFAVRGVPTAVEGVDRQFQSLVGRISSLNIEDRLDLDPLIREFRDSVQAGEPLIAQFQRLLDLQSQLESIEGRPRTPPTPLGPELPPGFGGNSRAADLGLAADDPLRQFNQLNGTIVSLKNQLDTLPLGIRTQFVPAIQAAEDEFRRLIALGPAATAEAVENASNEVDRLNQQLRRVSQVQALPNFAQALDDSAIRGSIGSLNALQQILSRVGAEAGSNAAVQFDRMRAAIQRATADGTIGSQAFQNELREIARDAAAAAAETGRIGQGAAFREIQRGGDIARGGFDRLSLATQQAAFAIDDFFSVQGDFSQRIRAVQNNVTQLAFILGGTRGLFIGLGVAIAAQAAVGLVRWYNEGRTAEDQTKALNDALARQKSLVEELAQAFESLGDSIARRAFSDSAQQARAFGKEIDDIVKKQKELRENRIADLDPGTQRERAEQNRIERELEASSDPRERARLAADLRRSQEREQLTRRAAVGQASPSIGRLQELVAGSATDEIRAYMQRRMIPPRSIEQAQQQELDQLGDGSNLRATRTAINNRIEELRSSPVANDEAVRRAVYELEQALAVIDRDIGEAADALAVSVLESANSLSLGIESAQQDVEDAIRRGVAGAADFQAGLDNTAKQLEAAEKRLAEAQNVRDPVQREEAVRAAQAEVRDLQLRQDAIAEEARNVRLTTGRGGQRTEAALSALQGNERFANEYGRLTARLRDAVDRETQARRNLDIANQEGNDATKAAARAELDAATAASDLAAATAEAALAMEKAIARIRKIGDDALRGSEQIADDAQKRFTQDPTAENRRERDAAEQQLIRDRERVARANNALDRARSVAEATDPRVRQINEELEAIRQERKQIGDKSAQDRTEEDARRSEELANREAELQAEREERLRQLTRAERDQQDAIAQEIAAREKMIAALEKQRAFDEEVERRRNPQGDAIRGLDLAETPGQRAARETAQGIVDIDAAFRERGRQLVEQFGGLFDIDAAEQVFLDQNEAARQESIRRFASEQRRAAAPAIFGFADSVENALLQGPSRAALNASDISTQEGARELNRLLRGDDSARDQNLIELQRQSQALDDVNAKLTALGNRVGVAL